MSSALPPNPTTPRGSYEGHGTRRCGSRVVVYRCWMELSEGARIRLDSDLVVWLTTITDAGAPAPYPVWFIVDGDDVVVFSEPSARRVHNIARRPLVSLHFNSDPFGGDVWVLTGRASTTPDVAPSSAPGYVDKYGESIERDLETTIDAVDATYNTEIRIRPERVVTV